MSKRNRLLLGVALILAAASARGDGINNPATGGNGNSVGLGQGINNLGVGGSAAASCTGTADLSTGCPQPMLGAL